MILALTNFQTDFNPDLTLEIPLNSPNINIELSSNIAIPLLFQTQRILLSLLLTQMYQDAEIQLALQDLQI